GPRVPAGHLRRRLFVRGVRGPRQARKRPRHITRSVMKLSARNKLNGKILEVKKGATTAHVRLEIGPGLIVTASITNEAAEELGLKASGTAMAIVKASDVMIAVD